jgi:formylglycine-generating enzyme required for sulfatase activity
VPKGLRSFDAHDADFFLELLPGPRDREGLPDSLRFWKTRVEETDPDNTFSVGLIYGPSGCGKSSLVKAGLLPRISEGVIPVYIEATPDETEARLLHHLQKRCPALEENLNLTDTMAALRRGQGIPVGKKVLIILDQFEQWLHAKKEEEKSDLVQALRQCDGGRVQCILMVRDDFWLAVSRLMRELEVPLVGGENIALADLFDLDHARKVLAAFGRAFGKLPENASETTDEQKDFRNQSVTSLAEEGKVICVRLALFAEMMKGKSWTPATLKEVGGTKGIGFNFLEETFSSSAASPEHRYHQKAVRAVLKTLLPESGTDIKGEMTSYDKLLEASGYARRSQDFDDLVRILDREVRLITPTDPDGVDSDDVSESRAKVGQKHYQLTHDYLVPSLRDWLARKQKETRRGRAELKLSEWAALWNSKPDNRHLPNVLEWINIRCLTDAKQWSESERSMMRRAARVQLAIWGTAALLLLMVGVSLRQYTAKLRRDSRVKRIESLVTSMQAAEGAAVPVVTQALEELPRELVLQELRDRYAQASGQQKLSLAYGLANCGEVECDTILGGLSNAETQASEVINIITALQVDKEQALTKLQAAVVSAAERQDWKSKSRLAIVAWHLGDKSIASEMLRAFPQVPTAKHDLSDPLQRISVEVQGLKKLPDQPWDPIQRTTFIAEFSNWSGDLEQLAREVGEAKVAHFRSGVSLALGGVKRPSDAAKAAWIDLISSWYSEDPDSGSHSAAGWALSQWELALPAVATTPRPEDARDWWRAETGLTMVKIPVGNVQGDDGSIRINNELWVSDREVTVRLFWRFTKDEEYDGPKPTWDGPYDFGGSSTEEQLDHPVQQVNWYDAVMFCNWLSEQHGFDRCYEIEATGPAQSEEYKVSLVSEANGFRLPTELEWEYACRGLTTTIFSFGDDEAYLQLYGKYTVNSKSQTSPVGSTRCNAWGLFDVHGNVQEWCWDAYDASGSDRVDRGGSWRRTAKYCRSSYRYAHAPTLRSNTLGFRLAVSLRN